MRSGAQTLVLLAAPLNVLILRTLEDGPTKQVDLRRQADSPAQTTLRAQLKRLVEIGAIDKQRRNRFPGVLEYELTPSGRDLLLVATTVERWLGDGPDGPLPIGHGAAKAAIKALAEAWSTAMLRAIAARPLSLTELDGVIPSLNYPALERRLAAMRLAGLIEARTNSGRGTPYASTEWLRRGVAPLAAAARWERRRLPESTTQLGPLEAETALLLAIPLVRISAGLSGSCRLAIELEGAGRRRLAGVLLEVRCNGRVKSSTADFEGPTDAWALGSPAAWLAALVERDTAALELGGDCSLGRGLVEGLHDALLGTPVRPRP